MQNKSVENIKIAEHGAWVALWAYVFLTALMFYSSYLLNSQSLRANAFNNLTDILSIFSVIVGLKMARMPRDSDHTYGHWKIESIAALISSFIMAMIGFYVLYETVITIAHRSQPVNDPTGAFAGIFAALIMLLVYFYTKRLAKWVKSPALRAISKDNLEDIASSLSTSVAVVAVSMHLPIIDTLAAIFITFFIFKTAFDVFRENAFSLSDGFDNHLLEQYSSVIEKIDKVESVKTLRGRTYGSNVFLDVVVEMSPDLSVYESHATTEIIERRLREAFGVFDIDVHVEPCQLADEEKEAALALKLLHLEEELLSGKALYTEDFIEIAADGEVSGSPTLSNSGISHYQPRRISQKTFLLSYQIEQSLVSSVWRRKTDWHCIYRQLTKRSD
jgi:cation diffusion facilitator family transporter